MNDETKKAGAVTDTGTEGCKVTRRGLLKATAATAGAAAMAGTASLATSAVPRIAYAAGSDEPIRIGFQVHRTGIGATYGRWYERTANAAAAYMNDNGGIAGRPVEIVPEDDGTDPKRGAEVIEKLASQHKVDFVYGTLFSHVVIGSAPRAGELKIPYFVVSEGTHVASGMLNRYVFQPGITDVRAQVTAMAPWVMDNLGKRVAMMFPDYAFGYDHRDHFTAAVEARGGSIAAQIAIPPTESSYTRYFPQVPADTEVLYHVMVGPGVLTFVKEMGEHYGSNRPRIFGFIDSLEGVDIKSPGPRVPRGYVLLGGDAALRERPRHRGEPALPGARRHQRRRRERRRPEGRLHQLSHVRLLGDALRDQAGRGAERLPEPHPGRRRRARRGDGELPRLQRGHRPPAGLQGVRRARCTSASGASSSPRSGAAGWRWCTPRSIEDGKYESDTDYTTQSL